LINILSKRANLSFQLFAKAASQLLSSFMIH
jgi:hypothetical protein